MVRGMRPRTSSVIIHRNEVQLTDQGEVLAVLYVDLSPAILAIEHTVSHHQPIGIRAGGPKRHDPAPLGTVLRAMGKGIRDDESSGCVPLEGGVVLLRLWGDEDAVVQWTKDVRSFQAKYARRNPE